MSKTGRKTQEMRHVSFRMPVEVHADYVAVAESRGVDLSAVLNWLLIEHRPLALLLRAKNDALMLQARAATLSLSPGDGLALGETQRELKELIARLQEVATKLSAQTIGKAA